MNWANSNSGDKFATRIFQCAVTSPLWKAVLVTGVSYESPVIQNKHFVEQQYKWRFSKAYVLNFLLILWLNCNVLTCPTLSFFSVLYSCPHCCISSLPNIPYSKPSCHPHHHCKTIRFPYSLVHSILQHPQAFLKPLFFLLSSPSGILGCVPQTFPLFPGLPAGLVQSHVGADMLAGEQFPVLLLSQHMALRGWDSVSSLGTLSLCVEQSYRIPVQYQRRAPQTFHLKRTLLV